MHHNFPNIYQNLNQKSYNIPTMNPNINTPSTPTKATIIIAKPYNIPITNSYAKTSTMHTTVNIIFSKIMLSSRSQIPPLFIPYYMQVYLIPIYPLVTNMYTTYIIIYVNVCPYPQYNPLHSL